MPALFLKTVLVLLALGALAIMVRFPQTEGRAAGLDLFSIYADPFIIYMYVATIPFFTGLFQSFKLLGFAEKNTIISNAAIKSVKTIRQCALATIGFIAAADVYLFIFQRGKDDIAGGVAMGLLIILISLVIAAAATIFQNILQSADTARKK